MAMACLDIVRALQAPTETTVSRLLAEYELGSDSVLEAIAKLSSILDQWEVELDPSLGRGGLDDVRVLRSRRNSGIVELVQSEISAGEGVNIEFKQTLGLDTKKFLIGGQPKKLCYSDEVVNSTLKTIAAFLNYNGGTLLIGVCDDGSVYSIDNEFDLVCPPGNYSRDGWELKLRALMEQFFVDGVNIQPYIYVGFCTFDGQTISRIVVGSRKILSFISRNGSDYLYIRPC